MIADPTSRSAAELQWAAGQLGVPPESSPEVFTAAFLRRLADEDFVPPPRLRQAWEVAARGSSLDCPALPWLDSTAEEELGGRIEAFAVQFFNLPPEQRSAQWERLYADARRWPRLEARLAQLKLGLAVEFTALPALNPRETRLIEWIRELFPMPPEQRALRRRRMLRDELGSEVRPWQAAAKELRRQQPAIAALAPDLLSPLANWSRNVTAETRNRPLRNVTVFRPRNANLSILNSSSKMITRIAIAFAVGCVIAALASGTGSRGRRSDIPVYPSPIVPSESPEFRRGIEEAIKILREKGELPYPAPPPSEKPSPIEPAEPTDRKFWEQMREMIENGHLTNPAQSPPRDPLFPYAPPSQPSTAPGGAPRKVLVPQGGPGLQPAPATPAGPKQ